MPRSRKDIRNFVNFIRQICDLEDTLEFPILYFLEHLLPRLYEDFSFEIVEDNEIDCEAIAYPNTNEILIRKSVYEGAFNGIFRDLFTIAHEVGHLFLHQETSISFARGSNVKIKPYEDPEWQANTFAGELLAPPHLIKNMSIDEVSQKCKVSRKTAEIQKSYCN
ncbi:ImmA/IrrE family metallo-endopeptidase [Paratissierella segnis]|jgi:Zn-dependent peptidase ImmA (M78 family)|nr:ImmA/IrrE family metallo-endopeptidase [Paratissierella segnis]